MLRLVGIFAVVTFFAFSLISCTPQESSSEGPETTGDEETSAGQMGEDRKGGEERTTLNLRNDRDPSPEPSGETLLGSERPENGSADKRADAEESMPPDMPDKWPVHSLSRRIPDDVGLGELEDLLSAPRGPTEVLSELFSELSESEVPAELLVKEVRGELADRLAYMLERAEIAPGIRVGRLTTVGDSQFRAPVVVFGAEGGRTSGEIYLAKRDGSWYISDILVDFTQIDEDSETPVFEPGTVSPTLLGFQGS